MLIDWFTVGAQIVNFAVLVWLLKRFLYRPVLDALDAREKRIAERLETAERRREEAEAERETFEERTAALERDRQDLLEQARREADAERHRLLTEAREAAEALRRESERSLRDQTRRLSAEVVRRTRDEVMSLLRRALADLAGANLEEAIADVFVDRLRRLDAPARARLAAAVERAEEPVRIRSAFPLTADRQHAIREAAASILPAGTSLRFETDDEVLAGIELIAPGEKLAWSLAEYLRAFEQRIVDLPVDTVDSDAAENGTDPTS